MKELIIWIKAQLKVEEKSPSACKACRSMTGNFPPCREQWGCPVFGQVKVSA